MAVAVIISGARADVLTQLQTPLFTLEIALLLAMVGSCAISAAVLAYPDMY